MAKKKCVDTSGLDYYMNVINNYINSNEQEEGFKEIVYEGAKVMTDGIRSEIKGAKIHTNPANGMTKADKDDLEQGLGIAKIQKENGETNTKIGFDGYSKNNYWTDENGNRKHRPIPLVARTVLKGTSWHGKDNFIGRANRKYKNKTVDAMAEKSDEVFKKHFNK